MKVLIVDDTKNIRTLLSTCLEIEGFQIVSVSDGRQALEHLLNEKFDLVFLDIKLPGISGTEILRKIREAGIKIPVVIMTAFATIKNAVECTKLGAVAYLQKPFTPEKVRHTLALLQNDLSKQTEILEEYLNTGRMLLSKGEYQKAFEVLKQALALEPSRKEIYTLLALVYEGLDNHEEAARFKAIVAQFPN